MRLRSMLLAAIILCGSISTAGAQAQMSQRIMRMMTPLMRFVPAVTFDGKTLLSYQGSLYNIPDRSPTFFANIFIKTLTAPGNRFQTSLLLADSDDLDGGTVVGGHYIMAVTLNQYADGVHAVFFGGCPGDGGRSWYYAVSQETVPMDDKWQVFTIDVVANGAATPSVRMLRNKAPLTMPVVETGSIRCQFSWNRVALWKVGGDEFDYDNVFYTGDAAEFYADMTGTLTVADVDKFVGTGLNGEVRARGLGLYCLGPTGNAPQLCLRGHAGYFPLGPNLFDSRRFSYGFALNEGGTLRTAKTDPCLVRRYGNGCWPTD